MNNGKNIICVFFIIFIVINIGYASEFKAKQPIVITSAGQSADCIMVKILAQKSGLKFTFDKLAKNETLEGNSSLIIVSGGSLKGLGAANIDKDQELARVQNLIQAAKAMKMCIIAMHVGGQDRRGKLSDAFNTVAAENADCLIVVKGGNQDQLFSEIAEKKKIPIFLIDKTLEAGDVIKSIFND